MTLGPRMQARRPRRTRTQGFTLVEVMVSLGIMTVGAMAILSLQMHATRANAHARQVTVAVQVAQRFVERLKQDAHTWTNPSTATTVAADLGATLYLDRILATPNVFGDVPADTIIAGRSNGFDVLGNDVDTRVNADLPAVAYCIAYRPSWVYFGRAMRIDVRVFWPRGGRRDMAGQNGDFPRCSATGAAPHTALDWPNGALRNDYHVVYLPTVIRYQEVPR